ncbi:ALF repeat-containing protein, partial [Streptomyces sp. NPDC005951]|uniref:ALF repeat-containing protein n=1 Tax=Streptomyces sp. NPDC005951 TaxID=3154573 RepID=UPI0033C50B37
MCMQPCAARTYLAQEVHIKATSGSRTWVGSVAFQPGEAEITGRQTLFGLLDRKGLHIRVFRPVGASVPIGRRKESVRQSAGPSRRRGRGFRWLGRSASGILPLALVATLISAAPVAAEEPAIRPLSDRARVLEAWKSSGPAVKAAAEEALTGSDQKIREFL